MHLSDNVALTAQTIAVAGAIAIVLTGITQCARQALADEQETARAAIAAGLVQGDLGRWVRPSVPLAPEARP